MNGLVHGLVDLSPPAMGLSKNSIGRSLPPRGQDQLLAFPRYRLKPSRVNEYAGGIQIVSWRRNGRCETRPGNRLVRRRRRDCQGTGSFKTLTVCVVYEVRCVNWVKFLIITFSWVWLLMWLALALDHIYWCLSVGCLLACFMTLYYLVKDARVGILRAQFCFKGRVQEAVLQHHIFLAHTVNISLFHKD